MAGPSSSPHSLRDPPLASTSTAPFRNFPKQALASVEYPGPVSHPSSLLKVVSQDDIDECFNAPLTEQRILEMSYKKEHRYGVPVKGTRVPSQKLLLKIVRRRRKRVDGMEVDGDPRRKGKERDRSSAEGVFMAEIVGPVPQTVRFRGGSTARRVHSADDNSDQHWQTGTILPIPRAGSPCSSDPCEI